MNAARRQHLGRRICSALDGMPSLQPSQVLYFVIAEYKGVRYVPERDTSRMSREKTLVDLRTGELENVVSIIETEITAGGQISSRDVTASMLVEAELMRDPIPPSDRLAALHDRAQDERKNWVAS